MHLFEHSAYDGHERVVFCSDADADLRAIVAIHDRTLGPAAGGCRMVAYASSADAVADVLRLSRGMTYKNALAGLPLGGGKAVIVADPRAPGKERRLEAFARFVEDLGGDYWTAIDVGVAAQDARVIAQRCPYVFALGDQQSQRGDTSYFTALGGFVGMRAALRHALGSDDFDGRRVALQGCGATGTYLAEMLAEAGAQLFVTDVHRPAAEQVARRFNAEIVAPERIYDLDVDVFSPCALGAVIDDDTVERLRARVVCGVANNQLAAGRHGDELVRRGIVYAPDYVVNAGGIIYASDEIFDADDEPRARRRIDAIGDTLASIFDRASATDTAPHRVADALAEERLRRER